MKSVTARRPGPSHFKRTNVSTVRKKEIGKMKAQTDRKGYHRYFSWKTKVSGYYTWSLQEPRLTPKHEMKQMTF